MKIFVTIIITSITGLLFAQSQSTRFKIESDVIGALAGDSNSTRFAHFGVSDFAKLGFTSYADCAQAGWRDDDIRLALKAKPLAIKKNATIDLNAIKFI